MLISAPAQSPSLVAAIEKAGRRLAAVLTSFAGLSRLGEAGDPDLIIVSVDALDEAALALLAEQHRRCPRPLDVFTRDASRARIQAAIGAGVDAYVIGGFSPERLNPIIDVATARFNEAQSLQRKLVEAQDKLSERKTIERAKGVLMKLRGIAEDDAFRALRKEAMDKNLRLGRSRRARYLGKRFALDAERRGRTRQSIQSGAQLIIFAPPLCSRAACNFVAARKTEQGQRVCLGASAGTTNAK